MASLVSKCGRWSLQFRLRPNQDRVTIALGAMTEEDAETIATAWPSWWKPTAPTARPILPRPKWVAKLADALHAKLAAAGLVTARDNGDAPAVPLLGPSSTATSKSGRRTPTPAPASTTGKPRATWSTTLGRPGP